MGDIIQSALYQDSNESEGYPHPNDADPSISKEIDRTLALIRDLLHIDLTAVLIPANSGQEFAPVVSSGIPFELVREFRLTRELAIRTQFRDDRAPVIVKNPRANLQLSPLCLAPDIRALTILPLVLDDQISGFLHLGVRDSQLEDIENSEKLSLVGHTMALALNCAELRQVEAKARRATAFTRERLAFLAVASGLLSSSLDYETTLSQITGMLVPRLADVCGIVLLDDMGTVNQVTIDGVDPSIVRVVEELQTRYSLSPESLSSVRRVLDTGKTEFLPSVTDDYLEQTASDAGHLDLLRRFGLRSMIIVPLNGRGKTIGALSLAYTTDDRIYTYEEVDFIEELAHRAALAVENARLYQESQRALEEREKSLRFREETLLLEREARSRAEAAQQREAFLSEASSVLSMSLEQDTTLNDLAKLVVSRVADWCTIELFDDSGASSLIATAHNTPEGEAILLRMREEYLPATITELPPRHILRYRRPTLIDTVYENFWFESAATSEHLMLLDQLETRALIVVPLFARNRTLGIMILGRSNRAETFHDDDIPMATDLGYRVALAIDNSRLYGRVQSVVEQQEEFISTASHELKTPLTTVKGYLQLINRQLRREDFSPERLVRFTRELETQVRRLEDLVSDLLDVSRIQQGRLELRLEQFNLVELASDVLSRFEYAPERSSNHELSLIAPEPIEGSWDRGRLDQVLTNLVSNALKYSPDGGEIIIRVSRFGDFAQVAVSDNGIGIGPSERASLFQPFTRGRNLKPKISGTGLGLYITQRIVENHRGTIFVKSQPGQGTTFTVQLPVTIESDV